MTTLRFRSAHARVDLRGVERLDDHARALILNVTAPMAAADSDPTPPDHALDVATLVLAADPDRAAATVVSAVDRALLASTPCLTVHAAALAGPRGAVIVPGVSGAGKTTLAAAAMQAGLRLLSDEAACLDAERDLVWAHPRPLGLSAHSRQLLGLPSPTFGPEDDERATAPSLLGVCVPTDEPVTPAFVMLPERSSRTGADRYAQDTPTPHTSYTDEPIITDSTSARGLAALLDNCLNTRSAGPWPPDRAWSRLAALMAGQRVVSLRYTTPSEGAAALVELLS